MQSLLEVLGIPYTGSGVSACMRCSDKVVAKHALRDAGLPTPDFQPFSETAFRELGAADALGAIEERLAFPIVVKPADQGSALGIRFARTPADVPAAIVAAFSYSPRVLLERHVHGRDLAVTVLGDEALPVVEAVPRAEDFYDFEARYTIGRTSFVCPAELGPALTARAQGLATDVARLLGCRGLARVDLMLEEDTQELFVLEVERHPRPDRHEPRPAGGRGGRDRLRRAHRPDRGAGPRAAGAARSPSRRGARGQPHRGWKGRSRSRGRPNVLLVASRSMLGTASR